MEDKGSVRFNLAVFYYNGGLDTIGKW